jgi:hypothetical protein
VKSHRRYFGTKGSQVQILSPRLRRPRLRTGNRRVAAFFFPDGAVRTSGAPKSVAPGAGGADNAVPSIAAAAALLVETCAMLAVQAARRGDHEVAKYLLEQALSVIAGRGPV